MVTFPNHDCLAVAIWVIVFLDNYSPKWAIYWQLYVYVILDILVHLILVFNGHVRIVNNNQRSFKCFFLTHGFKEVVTSNIDHFVHKLWIIFKDSLQVELNHFSAQLRVVDHHVHEVNYRFLATEHSTLVHN